MATWVTHLMIADMVLEAYPQLNRQGFCVGNIAPDCNVENADWTAFTPSRAVTHWMQGERKSAADCDAFYNEYTEILEMCVRMDIEVWDNSRRNMKLGIRPNLFIGIC